MRDAVPRQIGRTFAVGVAALVAGVVGGVAAVLVATGPRPALAATPSPVPALTTTPAFSWDAPDPDLVRDGSTWYAFTTGTWWGNDIGVLVDSSGDPQSGWTGYEPQGGAGSSALPVLPAWEQPGTQWAPGVFFWGGRWIMYYATSTAGSAAGTGHGCLSIATAASLSPRPIFTDTSSGPMYCQPSLGGSIDPQPFVDPATGQAWLLWKSNDGGSSAPAALWSAQLSADGGSFVTTPTPLLVQDTAQYPWETTIEQPQMADVNGTYVLLYSGGQWASSGYGMNYALCAGPAGPCNRAGPAPFLASYGDVAGPGGGSMTTDGTGRWWLAFHGWSAGCTNYGCGGARRLFVVPIAWASGSFPDATGSRYATVLDANGLVHVFVPGPGGHLLEYLPDHVGGHVWNVYDHTLDAGGGTTVTGDPGAVRDADGLVHVFVPGPGGHLLEYLPDHVGGQVWNVYDHTLDAGGGGTVSAAPAPALDANGLVHVYVDDGGDHLVEYLPDHVGGHVWNAYDHTLDAGGGGTVSAAPAPVLDVNGLVHVYVDDGGAHLVEYLPDHLGGRVWNAYDHTLDAGGGGPVVGEPDAVLDANGLVHVYVADGRWHLVEYLPDHVGGRVWNAYDHTLDAGGGTTVVGDPDALLDPNGLVHVFVAGPGGDVLEWLPDQVGGHVWNVYDHTLDAGGGT